jgi:hypothetical protein
VWKNKKKLKNPSPAAMYKFQSQIVSMIIKSCNKDERECYGGLLFELRSLEAHLILFHHIGVVEEEQ